VIMPEIERMTHTVANEFKQTLGLGSIKHNDPAVEAAHKA